MHTKQHRALVKLSAFALLLVALTLSSPAALAQTLAEIAAYQGPDRIARLIAGAKKEGAVSYYTSLVTEDSTPVIDAFKRRYGIDVAL